MSSSNTSTIDNSARDSWGHCGGSWGRKGNWSGMNIAGMVLGFVFFWPLGLVMLYWIMKGRNIQDLPYAIRSKVSGVFGAGHNRRFHTGTPTDNVVFNEYQQTQFDRISEIKEEIKERSRRFHEYRSDAKRRADEEEFNRFMADTPMPNNG